MNAQHEGLGSVLFFILDLFESIILIFVDIILSVKKLIFPQKTVTYYGKTALITGANGGLGRSICVRFAEKGCNLLCVESYENKDSMQSFLDETIHSINPNLKLHTHYVDLSDITAVENFARDVLPKYEISFGIFNAATNNFGEFCDINIDKFMNVLNVNLISIIIILKHLIPRMLRAKSGNIVAISSILSQHGIDNEASYCLSKSALNSLIEMARGYCDSKLIDSVKFHTIYPAKIDTPLFSHVKFEQSLHYILPLLNPDYVAMKIIDAISYDYKEVFFPTIPARLLLICRGFLPTESVIRLIRFLTRHTTYDLTSKPL